MARATRLIDRLAREPVAVANAVAAFVEAVIVCAIAFGAQLTGEQVAAITGVVIAAGQTIATIFGRRRVTPLVDPRDAKGRPLT